MVDIGTVINSKYRLVRLLGDGGMGSVYEAQHAGLGTRVAIKVLHPELARRSGLVERFLQEARVAAQIRNPYIVQVHDVDRTNDGQAYIVMELLEGEPLSSVLDRQRKLPVATACEYTLQILSALEAAHALGVIHRDLKPENVFVTFSGGRPILKLIDFGIAKARRSDLQQKNLTVAGVVMGTAEYMAPEQARSADRVDARADLYAVGVMLYEMIAGTRPVNGEDARVIALKVERGEIVPLVQAAPDVPRELAGLVHRAMAARPELRFASATEMRLALEKVRRPGTAVLGAAAGGAHTAAGVRPVSVATPAPAVGDSTEAPPVNTMRAPPIASALSPGGPYAGAAVPAAPPGNPGARRRGRMSVVALVAVPLLVGGGVVAVLIATGTWASTTTDPSLPTPAPSPAQPSSEPTPTQTATPQGTATSEVPKLLPVHTSPAPVVPHPTSSVRPAVVPAQEGGAPPPPFLFPSGLPSTLPPFPSVLPFPTNFPAPFPSVLPVWPPPLQTSSSQAPSPPPGPGY